MPENEDIGLYVPTTQVWDVDEIYGMDVSSKEFKELLVRMYQNLNTSAVVLNKKESAIYSDREFLTGQVYFPTASDATETGDSIFRPTYRKVIDFGALPNANFKDVAHNITFTDNVIFTRIYGAATNPTYGAVAGIPIPYASPTDADNIELSVGNANVTITTGSNRTAFTQCYVVLEYINY